MATTLHLPSESKALEYRSALTPTTKALLDAGFKVNIERNLARIFEDSEFEAVGANLVPEGSWVDAPHDHIIVGLKELPEDSFALKHTHVQFAHCFKNQGGWQDVLSRFSLGGGTLLDLEFLTDESGRRVAAWLNNPPTKPFPGVKPYANQDLLLDDVRARMAEGEAKAGRKPQILVMGGLGRCGSSAVDLCRQAGIPEENILKWDMAETAKGGPFSEIIESDVFINCIYLSSPIPPLVNEESLASTSRRLSVVCDVSCDTTNPHNPIPIPTQNSTFSSPTLPVKVPNDPPLTVISIDHLPSLLPRESSEAFSHALLPSLLQLKDRKESKVWQQAEQLYRDKVLTLPETLRTVVAAVTRTQGDVETAKYVGR